ncbi:unnamed protein product [Xylocopa violacea]|uniref:Uncharacterized protein n=1 Tax=Xylocopa violacea TaxID=135666 RepID=A0ABP1P2V2_XYLVO
MLPPRRRLSAQLERPKLVSKVTTLEKEIKSSATRMQLVWSVFVKRIRGQMSMEAFRETAAERNPFITEYRSVPSKVSARLTSQVSELLNVLRDTVSSNEENQSANDYNVVDSTDEWDDD